MKSRILISIVAVLLLAGVFTSFSVTTVHAAKWTLNLDASSLSAVDSTITASGTQAHGFRVGAVLTNASFTGNALTVYGWQFQITYNATAFVPQGDPNTLATPGNPSGLYTDSSTNTVLYGATTSPTTCPSWNSRLTAGTAFGTNSIATSGSVGQIQVAFTMLGTNPAPVVSAASCIFANVQFEIINPVTTPQTFTISNVVFVDNTGANIPGVVPGAPVTETITDVPPIARVVATGLPSGSSACVPVTGAVCSADAVQFDGTSSTGAISAAPGTAGFFWDFGDPAAACGVTTNDDCDGFYSGSTFSGGITCTNGNLATFGCQGGVAIHDYGVHGTFNVTLRVQDTAGNTGSARDTLGNVILNNQPSHTQLLNFAVPIVSQAHPTTTNITCSPGSVQVSQSSSCTATVTDTSASGATTPTGTVDFTTNSTGTFTPATSCTLAAGATAGTATCSVTYTPGASASGHHLITGKYAGDSSHTTSSGTFLLAVTPAPPHPTTTSVACSPGSVQVSTATSCTVTVTDTSATGAISPTGTVSFTTNSTGTFTPATSCTLAAGAGATATCSVTYTPGASATGHHLITGNYAGDSTHTTSSGTFLLAVTPAPPHTTTTTVDCTPSSVADNSASTCTATVTDTNASPTTPTGTVTFTTNSTGTFNPAAGTCTLAAGATAGTATCSVSYTPTVVGHHLITGNYPGDSTHTSSSGSFNLASTQRTTTTTVACTPAPVTTGSSTSCTATVSDSTATGTVNTPTGTVSFTTNSTGTFSPATSCTLAASATAGTASCSVTYTPGITGHHLITGSYPGGTIFTASQGSYNLAVVTAPPHSTTIAVTCSPGSVQVSTPTTCTATVTDTSATGATSPTGTVSFTTNSTGTFTPTASCTLVAGAAGTATCSVTYTPDAGSAGHHLITGDYSGDTSHTTSSGTFTLTVTAAPPHSTTTTVQCSPSTLDTGTATNCTATVTDTSSSPTTPTGSASFTTNSTGTFAPASGTCTLVAGAIADTATCSVSYTPTVGGHHMITGSYGGDSTHSSSQGSFVLAVTAPPHSTTTTLTCSPGTVQVGTPSTCTATVTDIDASPTTPTGTVSFTTNSTGTFTPSTSCTLAAGPTAGTASCSVTYTPDATAVGHHLITGSYSGDSTHTSSSGSFNLDATSVPPPPPHSTSTTVDCSPASVQAGSATSCTANVTDTSSSPTTPTGTVNFTTNSTGNFTPSPGCTLAPGATADTATCTVTYTPTVVGHHLITGNYAGDSTHDTSSGSFTLEVTSVPPHSTTTSVTCLPGSVQAGTPTTFTATVTDTSASGATTPTGTVSFTTRATGTFTQGNSCTLAEIITGTASCSVTYNPGVSAHGNHIITGNYAGDSTHNSSSGSFTLAVTARVKLPELELCVESPA